MELNHGCHGYYLTQSVAKDFLFLLKPLSVRISIFLEFVRVAESRTFVIPPRSHPRPSNRIFEKTISSRFSASYKTSPGSHDSTKNDSLPKTPLTEPYWSSPSLYGGAQPGYVPAPVLPGYLLPGSPAARIRPTEEDGLDSYGVATVRFHM